MVHTGFVHRHDSREFGMRVSKPTQFPFRHGIKLQYNNKPLPEKEARYMQNIPYASAVGSLMYAMLCTRPDICHAVGLISQF